MLRLDAMTLRGIGSYVRGSRLELRPLTILSGVNGSGKSTWFKTLAMLKRSSINRKLPFAFDVDDSDAYDVGFMNYSLHNSGDLTTLADTDQQERDFGPAACVGLEFFVTEDFLLDDPVTVEWTPQNSEQRFLVNGDCIRGMKLRVRIAHPTGDMSDQVIPGMRHAVELQINESFLQFEKPHIGDQGNRKNSTAEDYQFGCSPCFGQWADSSLRPLAAKRIAQIVGKFFSGYFHISAIREFQSEKYTTGIDPPKDLHERRDVGANGLAAIAVLDWNRSGRLAGDEDLDPVEREVYGGLERLLDIRMGRPEGFNNPNGMARFDSNYLGGSQVPKQFSSGLHQLLPIIVQASVMRATELLSIENPEVHLHPDLQLKVSEYLLEQSRRGRWIIVETHSDLIIRRVVRAILEEEDGLSQQHFSLNFSRPERESNHGGVGSTLRQYGIDKDGRIEWPDGFMDASIDESQRLMDVMYGRRGQTDGEVAE